MVNILRIKVQSKRELAKSYTGDAEKKGSEVFPVCMFPCQKSAQSVKAQSLFLGFKSCNVKTTFA